MLMPLRRAGTLATAPAWLCRLLAACLILGVAAAHVAYLALDCPLDLAPDEAHYWDWSRHLDWSYYSKGPLVAYLIRASCELFGPWSLHQTGSLMLAVRLPAVVCGSLLLVSLYVLTVQVYRREGLALAVVALAQTVPMVAVGSSLMTIDAPYTCCWGWALVVGHRAIFRGSGWAWPVAGLIVGLGILAKYTMVLWLPSVALFLLTSSAHRSLLCRRGFWVMTVLAGAGCLPILLWNVQHDWVSVRHVNSLAGLHEGPRFHWLGPLVFLASQCGLLLVFWFVAWGMALWTHRPWREPDAGLRYLWWLSAPMFAVFWGFSLKTGGGEVNWPVTAYVSGLILAAGWLGQQLESPRTGHRRLVQVGLVLTCALGLAVTGFMHESRLLHPVLARLTGEPTETKPFPLRRLDPTCRLRGWRTLATAVDELRGRLATEGVEPVLAGSSWGLPGELGFYCTGHPQVYSVGVVQGDRHSQYDLWHPNPVDDPEAFRGRTFVLVGDIGPEVLAGFERVESGGIVNHAEDGRPIARWVLHVGHGFRGFSVRAGRDVRPPF
jgi:hypothetical protein